ncbi:MAG TPA: dihydrofolate reductase family protein [Gemmatimonadaceae bacterium]|jgi:dihydrofolate reductase
MRKVIVHIAASADGYIARPDGDLDWLTSRPKPKGFYGMGEFMKTVDTHIMGRKTYEIGLKLGGTFDGKTRNIIFSRSPKPMDAPKSVEFVNAEIGPFIRALKQERGKNIWLMGGGELIADFLDAKAIDEFVVSVVPVFIGDGIPLIARRRRETKLTLESTKSFDDGLVQLRYLVP